MYLELIPRKKNVEFKFFFIKIQFSPIDFFLHAHVYSNVSQIYCFFNTSMEKNTFFTYIMTQKINFALFFHSFHSLTSLLVFKRAGAADPGRQLPTQSLRENLFGEKKLRKKEKFIP